MDEFKKCIAFKYFFFFSSRRRHTISKRDWSSDVCSSDLNITFTIGLGETDELELLRSCASQVFGIQAYVKQRESTYQVTFSSLWVHRLFSEFEIGRASCRERELV